MRKSGRDRKAISTSGAAGFRPDAKRNSFGLSRRNAEYLAVHLPGRTCAFICPFSSTATGSWHSSEASFQPAGSTAPSVSSRLLPETISSTSPCSQSGIPSSNSAKSFTERKSLSASPLAAFRSSQSCPAESQTGFSTGLPSSVSATIPTDAGSAIVCGIFPHTNPPSIRCVPVGSFTAGCPSCSMTGTSALSDFTFRGQCSPLPGSGTHDSLKTVTEKSNRAPLVVTSIPSFDGQRQRCFSAAL